MNTRPTHLARGTCNPTALQTKPVSVDAGTYHAQPSPRSAYRPAAHRQPRTIRRLARLARWHALRSSGSINWSEIGIYGIAIALTVTSAIVFKELRATSGVNHPLQAAAATSSRATAITPIADGRSLPEYNQSADNSDETSAETSEQDAVEAGLVDPMAFAYASDATLLDPLALEPGRPLAESEMLSGFDPRRVDSITTAPLQISEPAQPAAPAWPLNTKWFNGRPVRPVRTMSMVVTAYSPDSRSCGDSADGITASLHDVDTNAGKLVAADKRVLPLGSMISVPGYDAGRIVPVLDVGGAIKGNRLDLLFPTHEQARKFGKRTVQITVWGYADGAGKADWRKTRDSR